MRALLGPAHRAEHDVDLALLGGLDQRRPLHLLRLDLEAEICGDHGQQLAVGADQLAVLPARHRHVAVDADRELAGLDRLRRRRFDGSPAADDEAAATSSAAQDRRRLRLR